MSAALSKLSALALNNMAEDWPFALMLLSEQDETILWVNQMTQEWLGKSKRRVMGKNPWDLVNVDMTAQTIVQRCIKSGAPLTIRNCAITRPGHEEEYVDITAYPTDDGVGLSLMMAGVQPRRSSVNKHVVSGMGRLIAHELKNPLAGIKGAAQLLRDDVESEEGQSLIDLIGSEIDRIRRLADRMETLGDKDPENEDRVNIHEILRRARRIIQSANPELSFNERYDPSLPHIKGDADTLMQALLNLIKNAAEAVEKNGKKGNIKLETRFRSGISSVESSKSHNLPIEVLIIDNGSGIPDDLKGQLFQPFVTTKPEGQGLGLSLVSKVVRAHGGIIEVKSRPGKTTFSILLPTPNGDAS